MRFSSPGMPVMMMKLYNIFKALGLLSMIELGKTLNHKVRRTLYVGQRDPFPTQEAFQLLSLLLENIVSPGSPLH